MHTHNVAEESTPRNDNFNGAPCNGPFFGIVPCWVSRHRLSGVTHRVLLVIASHARKQTRITVPIAVEDIANEAIANRRTVQRAICRLESVGVIQPLRGGGRGCASQYRIILEEPADAKNSGNTTALLKGGNTTAVSGKRAVVSSRKGGHSAAPTDITEKERTPHARARRAEEGRVSDAFDRFQAGPEIYRLASELGIDDAENVIACWRLWNIEKAQPFPAKPNASLERWMRKEWPRHQKRGPPKPRSKERRPGGLVANTLNLAKKAYLNG